MAEVAGDASLCFFQQTNTFNNDTHTKHWRNTQLTINDRLYNCARAPYDVSCDLTTHAKNKLYKIVVLDFQFVLLL